MMKLRAALAVLLVYGNGIHNPPLSEVDAATVARARKVVRKAAAHVLKTHRHPVMTTEQLREKLTSAEHDRQATTLRGEGPR